MNQKKIIAYILILVFLSSFSFQASATELCSKNGYTILTINGILTDEAGALKNRNALSRNFNPTYNNQPLKIDYVYNASHLGGAGDIAEVLAQGLLNEQTNYDLTEMLNDASQKVTTQKLLLVGHSQGNFYANNFYNTVASQAGGVPSESIGVYGVASPASYVAGGGKYMTSSSDKIIKNIAGSILNVLPTNIDIKLQSGDDTYGHDFSNVYLKYQSDRIVSDIKSSLDKLQNNDVQDSQSLCINPPELSIKHKIVGVVLAITDPTVSIVRNSLVGVNSMNIYSMGNFFTSAILAISNNLLDLSANALTSSDNSGTPVTQPNPENTISILPAVDKPSLKNKTPDKIETPILNINTTTEIENKEVVSTPTPEVTPPIASPPPSNTVTHGNSSPNIATPIPTPSTPTIPIDTTPPVITMNGNAGEYITLNSSYTDEGATATDDVDGVTLVTTDSTVDTSHIGDYVITYSATDTAGNTATATRNVKVATYKYIPKYSFGTGNGDGNNWQVWGFNGSNIYNWTDTYVDNYLRQQFKIQAYSGGFWCSQCLEMGIFNHDPQKGFERSDLVLAGLDNNPQNMSNDIVYDVDIQWDELGYRETVSHSGIIDSTIHKNITNMNNDLWVGWNGSLDDFRIFPSGHWIGTFLYYGPPDNTLTGGTSMVLQPYSVYVYSGPPRSKEKAVLIFNFDSLSITGVIDESNHTISLTVPFGTDVTNLIPTITTSDKSSISPNSGIATDFTNPVTYTVTAENISIQSYTVTVTIAPDPNI